ncbi:MAG TPA: hypothetical protein VLF59_01910 [Candidatus Saccharimonadales bacterium]|nr:hypothetical protein [Candidatus Saccharimonadales bacterium]
MSTIRDSLQYQQSPYTVTDHAAEADAILEACGKKFPQLVPFLLEPSNLLALGGLRGVSPYANFGVHDKLAGSEEFQTLLRRYGIRLIREERHYGKKTKEVVYMVVHTGAFEAVPDLYPAVKSWWEPKPHEYSYLHYLDWYTYNLAGCENELENNRLPSGWLAEWWTPHNICFGMLLGYPGVAICSLAAADMANRRLGVPPEMGSANFKYPANKGAALGYDLQMADSGSRQIAAHQKRWQSFFDMLYEAWPEARVKQLLK